AVSPSRTPLRSRPVASTAVYSKAPNYFALVLARHAQHFFDRRGARQYLRTTVVADAVGHGPCVLLQILLACAVVNHRTHRVIDHHQLVNAGAASEALIAVGAGAIERRGWRRSRQIQQAPLVLAGDIGFLAVRVQHAHQALSENADQARGKQEGFHTHVAQTSERTDCGVGVQRGHHQVSRERGLHGDVRGFQVADFADHHHVRVLAQDGAQSAREGHLDLGVHLRLADAVDVVLDRILDRQDVARVVVDALECRVQRRGLAGAGRAGDQEDAVRLVDQLVHLLLRARIHAERAELEAARLLVEQTQYDALAVTRGNRRDAHVDRATRDAQRDAAVLRQTLLRDIQLRHDLDTRDHQRSDRAPGLEHFAQYAVDAEAHDQAVLERLDVNIGRVVLHRLGEDRVDQLDDRRLIVAFEQVGLLRQILREVREVGFVIHAADHLLGNVRSTLELLPQQLLECVIVDAPQLQGYAEHAAHFGDRRGLRTRAIDSLGGIFAGLLHEHAVALAERERHRVRWTRARSCCRSRSRFWLRAHTTSVSMRCLLWLRLRLRLRLLSRLRRRLRLLVRRRILLERRGLGRFRRIRSRRRRLRAGGRISVLRQLFDRRQQRLTLAWQQRDLAMAALQLLVAYDVVLRVRLDRGLGAVADDRRTDEQHQVALFLRAAASLEQLADQRNRAQHRHAVLAFAGRVGDQAAEHDYAAIVDEHGRRDCALVGDQVDRALLALRDAGVFLLDLEHHRVAFI